MYVTVLLFCHYCIRISLNVTSSLEEEEDSVDFHEDLGIMRVKKFSLAGCQTAVALRVNACCKDQVRRLVSHQLNYNSHYNSDNNINGDLYC